MGSALRVFVSYTSELGERPPDMTWVEAAGEAISFKRHAQVQMIHFGSQGRPPADVCRAELAQCQVWVGILGSRYGSLVPGTERSYTEMEFDEAGERGLHRIAVLLEKGAPVGQRDDAAVNRDRQDAFRQRVRSSELTVAAVSTPAELFVKVFTGMERLEHLRPKPEVLHPPPPVIPLILRDRQPERQELRAAVQGRQDRVFALVGDHGIGKTAMVAQLIGELESDRSEQGFGFLDYLSASGHLSVSGAQVLKRLVGAIRSPLKKQHIVEVLTDKTASWYEQVEDVLDALDEDVLVVLDHAEELLDERGVFHDWMLNQLVTDLSRRDDHHVSLLLVSALQPSHRLLGHRRSAVFDLPGLLGDDDDARLLLQDLAGTAMEALGQDVSRVVQVAGRHPRTLELLVAAFNVDSSLRVEALHELDGLDQRHRVSRLVEHLDASLPDEMRAVVQAVAILGLPMKANDVAAVLNADNEPGVLSRSAVTGLLAELARIRILRAIDGKYSLPPEEGRIITDLWCSDEEGQYNYREFARRAADHLAQSKWKRKPSSIEELAPHFREIALRLELGQFATSIELMDDLDHHYLRGWGHRHVLMPWRRQLLGWKQGRHYWRVNLSAMVVGAVELDELDEAVRLLDQLRATMPGDSASLGSDEAAQDKKDELAVLTQLGYTAFLDGRLYDAERWYREELRLAVQPYEKCRANLGLGLCLLDRGRTDDSAEHLRAAWTLVEVTSEAHNSHAARAGVLLARAELARVVGDSSMLQLTEEALRAAALAEDERMRIRCLDLRAALKLDKSLEHADADALIADAVTIAGEAAELAARTGVTDVTRTAHATLAVALLRQGDKSLDAARSAATAAARFYRSKRGLVGYVVLGVVQFRDRRRPSAETRARDAFYQAIAMGEQFPDDRGRPYWVWDALGLAHAGLYLCRVDGAHAMSVSAYRRARGLTRTAGAVRRAELFLDTLAADMSVDALRDILGAARGDDTGVSEASPLPSR
jgi:hypothetical protein